MHLGQERDHRHPHAAHQPLDLREMEEARDRRPPAARGLFRRRTVASSPSRTLSTRTGSWRSSSRAKKSVWRPGTRVGVAAAEPETAHNLEHSIANAGLPNIVLVGACSAAGTALGRLVRRVDVMVRPRPGRHRITIAGGTVAPHVPVRLFTP